MLIEFYLTFVLANYFWLISFFFIIYFTGIPENFRIVTGEKAKQVIIFISIDKQSPNESKYPFEETRLIFNMFMWLSKKKLHQELTKKKSNITKALHVFVWVLRCKKRKKRERGREIIEKKFFCVPTYIGRKDDKLVSRRPSNVLQYTQREENILFSYIFSHSHSIACYQRRSTGREK